MSLGQGWAPVLVPRPGENDGTLILEPAVVRTEFEARLLG